MSNPSDFVPQIPCTKSWSHYSTVPESCGNKEPCILGVDEAGRGPVMGCMVYAVAYLPEYLKQDLAKIGFADSKVLKPEQRQVLFEKIGKEQNWIGWGVHSCSPQDISESSYRRNKYNLNELAHDTTIGMIHNVLKLGVNLTEIYVDTVGGPEKYQEKLSKEFPQISITVAKKADSKYPIVSAASICAKVTRDFTMKEWIFAEHGVYDDREFGSGYPGDPNTIRWMANNMDDIFGFPRIIRFSWSTTVNFMQQKCAKFTWPGEEDDQQPKLTDMWSQCSKKQRDNVYKQLGVRITEKW